MEEVFLKVKSALERATRIRDPARPVLLKNPGVIPWEDGYGWEDFPRPLSKQDVRDLAWVAAVYACRFLHQNDQEGKESPGLVAWMSELLGKLRAADDEHQHDREPLDLDKEADDIAFVMGVPGEQGVQRIAIHDSSLMKNPISLEMMLGVEVHNHWGGILTIEDWLDLTGQSEETLLTGAKATLHGRPEAALLETSGEESAREPLTRAAQPTQHKVDGGRKRMPFDSSYRLDHLDTIEDAEARRAYDAEIQRIDQMEADATAANQALKDHSRFSGQARGKRDPSQREEAAALTAQAEQSLATAKRHVPAEERELPPKEMMKAVQQRLKSARPARHQATEALKRRNKMLRENAGRQAMDRRMWALRHRNGVVYIETQGEPEKDPEPAPRQLSISTEWPQIDVRFLTMQFTRLFKHDATAYTREEVATLRERAPAALGVDVCGAEQFAFTTDGSFAADKNNFRNFREIFTCLRELAEPGQPRVFRIHVGEGYANAAEAEDRGFIRNWDYTDALRRQAENNITWVLSAIAELNRDGSLPRANVIFRLGHLAALTVAHAERIRALIDAGVPLFCEVNLTSNVRTGVLNKRKGSAWLLLLKHDIPSLLGTDGQGVMKTSLPKEYAIAADILLRFRRGEVQLMSDQNPAFSITNRRRPEEDQAAYVQRSKSFRIRFHAWIDDREIASIARCTGEYPNYEGAVKVSLKPRAAAEATEPAPPRVLLYRTHYKGSKGVVFFYGPFADEAAAAEYARRHRPGDDWAALRSEERQRFSVRQLLTYAREYYRQIKCLPKAPSLEAMPSVVAPESGSQTPKQKDPAEESGSKPGDKAPKQEAGTEEVGTSGTGEEVHE